MNNIERPLIVQSDRSILAETDSPVYAEARDAVMQFAELVKSPEHIHTYQITPLSLWNAAAGGMTTDDIVESLKRYARYDIPGNLLADIDEFISRYGRVRLEAVDDELHLVSQDTALMAELGNHKQISAMLVRQIGHDRWVIAKYSRGLIKQNLIRLGFPVEDVAGYVEGSPMAVSLEASLPDGAEFTIREYQRSAADSFWAGGSTRGGSGVVVLPCGAGKTIVGMTVMDLVQCETLILTTSITAVRQWKRELIEKTSLTEDQVGEYTGEVKEVRPVTVTTYQILTYRPPDSSIFPHFELFTKKDWGLIIYDEVHLLPAPVFRITAELQVRRRLGLTATLVREDGHEEDVFSLIGPKRYDVPWKTLEAQGWIAEAECIEIRHRMDDELRMEYALASRRAKFRLASENPAKLAIVESLLAGHTDDLVLIIGQYLDQLHALAEHIDAPIITGRTPNSERERLYAQFRSGELKHLVVSKVGNFAIDLPDANVLIQLSGTFGSRQEEAQRLGRILRPKKDGSIAKFYSLVTRESTEQEFAMNRQLFLTEQGYGYRIVDGDEVVAERGKLNV
jgi:DNA excision repair protein ERCC-3